MFYVGFMTGTAFGILLVAMLRSNKPEDIARDIQSGYNDGYEKGYADGMSDGYALKR